jgi:hypothetical protein
MVTGMTGHSRTESTQVISAHSSPEELNLAQAQVPSNDSSNVSINSDKDEIVVLSTKNSSNHQHQLAENKGRKRKRLEFKPDTPRPDNKHDRKITDYIKVNEIKL